MEIVHFLTNNKICMAESTSMLTEKSSGAANKRPVFIFVDQSQYVFAGNGFRVRKIFCGIWIFGQRIFFYLEIKHEVTRLNS